MTPFSVQGLIRECGGKPLMKRFFLLAVATASIALALGGCGAGPASDVPAVYAQRGATAAKKTMRPFRSEEELKRFFRELAEKQKRDRRLELRKEGLTAGNPAPSQASQDKAENDESITNVQHAGVDEGDIVKLHG